MRAVNPGGWAPNSVVRVIFKREYPRFVRRFSKFVIDKCEKEPIAWEGLKVLNKSKFFRGGA